MKVNDFLERNTEVNNLVLRLISGIAFVAIMVTSICMSSYVFGAVFFLATVLSLREFYVLTEKCEGVCADKWMSIVGGALLFVIAFCVAFLHKTPALFSVYFLCVACTFAFELFRKTEKPVLNLGVSVLGHFYIAVPFSMFCMIEGASGESNHSRMLLLAFFVIIWASDTGAYIVGRFLGRHKMFERISPKKTWEGFFGGLAFAILSGLIFHYYECVPTLRVGLWITLSVCVFVFGVLGDLVESMFKRSLKVKDSGNIIPGHGGMLDRFDSALLAAPVLYVIFSLIV